MSIMFFKVRSVARARGGNALASAAYVSRSRLVDAQTGRAYDYRRVPGLAHSELILPANRPAPDWMADRSELWNAAESREPARNSRVGREYTVALPHELPDSVRIELARELARRIAERHQVAIDVAVHRPGRGDPRNHHVHLLATTREFDANGFTRKATIERNNDARRALGLEPITQEYRALRVLWADVANQRLRDASLSERLEPKSRRTLELERIELAAIEPPRQQTIAERALENWKSLRMNRDAGRELLVEPIRSRGRDHDHGLGL